MSSEINENELSTALLQLDWNDFDNIRLLQEQFLQPWQHQVERAKMHTKCLLISYCFYPSIICNIIDKIMDNFLNIVEVISSCISYKYLSF